MKAIVFKDVNGRFSFLFTGDNDHVESKFKEMCVGSGGRYCANQEDFEKLKELFGYDEAEEKLTEISFKRFIGAGLYDHEGNFYHKLPNFGGELWVIDYTEVESNIGPIVDYKQSLSFNNGWFSNQ